MKTCLSILAAAGIALIPCSAWAQTRVPLTSDGQGRPTAPVTINGAGPFPMVIDTAAQRTGLGTDLVSKLSLKPVEGGGAVLHGASGQARMNLFRLDSIAIGSERRSGVVAIQLGAGGTTSAHAGVLGADTFAGKRLELDFEHGQLKVDESVGVPSGFSSVPADFLVDTFVRVPVTIGGVAATAVIDTGAQHSVANSILMKMLGYTAGDPRLSSARTSGGATSHSIEMVSGGTANVKIGDVTIDNVDLRFADLPVFHPLGMMDGPAIILGAEILKRMKAIAVDYRRKELQLRP